MTPTSLFVVLVGIILSEYGTRTNAIRCPQVCRCQHGVANCSDQNLRILPENLDADIIDLILSRNKLRQVNDLPVSHFNHLLTLDISFNEIDEFSWPQMTAAATGASSLARLDLSGNRIGELNSNAFRQLAALRSLNVNKNQLTAIPRLLFAGRNVPKLTSLDLSDNWIEAIHDDAFANQTNLRFLHVERNQLSVLNSEVFRHLVSLEEIHLAGNQLRAISDATFLQTTRLFELNLERNLLRHDQPLLGLEKLHNLSLGHNHFASIPSSLLAGMTNLRVLRLDGNPLESLTPRSFRGNLFLEILTVADTELTTIPTDSLVDLRSLEVFSASGCRITSIEKGAFPKVKQIREIDLRRNALSHLDPDIHNWTSVLDLDLQENPWACDCSMTWIVNISLGGHLQEHLRCASPPEQKGQKVIETVRSISRNCSSVSMTHSNDDGEQRPADVSSYRTVGIVVACVIPVLIIMKVAVLLWPTTTGLQRQGRVRHPQVQAVSP